MKTSLKCFQAMLLMTLAMYAYMTTSVDAASASLSNSHLSHSQLHCFVIFFPDDYHVTLMDLVTKE